MRSSKSKVAADAAGTNPSYLFKAHTHTHKQTKNRHTHTCRQTPSRRAESHSRGTWQPAVTHAHVCERDGHSVLAWGVGVDVSPFVTEPRVSLVHKLVFHRGTTTINNNNKHSEHTEQ